MILVLALAMVAAFLLIGALIYLALMPFAELLGP